MVSGEALNKCNYVKAGVRIVRVIDVFFSGERGRGYVLLTSLKFERYFFPFYLIIKNC